MFDFQKFIQRVLHDKSLSQTALAQKIGVTRRQVVLWLAGQGDPGDEACYALERLMGLDPETLSLHKQLNRIEALGHSLPKMLDPEILKDHGIIQVKQPKSGSARGLLLDHQPTLSDDARHAAELADKGEWTALAHWALGKATAAN